MPVRINASTPGERSSKLSEHVFIVGGSSGIGLATAKLCLRRGYRVTIAGRDEKKLAEARQSLGTDLSAVVLDASNPSEVREVLASLVGLDHLVLAMGSGKGVGAFTSLPFEEMKKSFEEKVYAHFDCAQAAFPHLSREGSITFVSAVSATTAMPGTAAIGSANAAVEAFVPTLAAELKPLRVNGVSPGVIDTPWWSFLAPEQRERVFSEYAAKTPVGRIGCADDIAEAIAFLVGNTFMSGHTIVCDGGLRLTP
jgi:NAD(P)-dependent dehydrogenase (short-subunit alcohol dehydrogenase family)